MSIVLNPSRSNKYNLKRDDLGAILENVKEVAKFCKIQHQQLQKYITLESNAYKKVYWMDLERYLIIIFYFNLVL